MQPFPKNEGAPDFSNPAAQQSYVQNTHDDKNLMQKELDVNQAEQNLLEKRMELIRQFINDLPSSDPQYSMLLTQLHMDQIELDELKVRATLLVQKLTTTWGVESATRWSLSPPRILSIKDRFVSLSSWNLKMISQNLLKD